MNQKKRRRAFGLGRCDPERDSDYTSDERLKKNITPIEDSIEKLLALSTVTYDWKSPLSPESNRQQIGLLAQEVQPGLRWLHGLAFAEPLRAEFNVHEQGVYSSIKP